MPGYQSNFTLQQIIPNKNTSTANESELGLGLAGITLPKFVQLTNCEISSLINNLGSQRFSDREQASLRLGMAPEAIEALNKAALSQDPEVTSRAARALKDARLVQAIRKWDFAQRCLIMIADADSELERTTITSPLMYTVEELFSEDALLDEDTRSNIREKMLANSPYRHALLERWDKLVPFVADMRQFTSDQVWFARELLPTMAQWRLGQFAINDSISNVLSLSRPETWTEHKDVLLSRLKSKDISREIFAETIADVKLLPIRAGFLVPLTESLKQAGLKKESVYYTGALETAVIFAEDNRWSIEARNRLSERSSMIAEAARRLEAALPGKGNIHLLDQFVYKLLKEPFVSQSSLKDLEQEINQARHK